MQIIFQPKCLSELYGHTRTGAVVRAADGDREVPREEGQPTDEEAAEHDAQRDERLVLLTPGRVDPMTLAEP